MFISDSLQADVGEHSRPQVRGLTLEPGHTSMVPLAGSTTGLICGDRGGVMNRGRAVGQFNTHGLSILYFAEEAFRKGELDFQRRHGCDPEQAVADPNFLPDAHITAGDDPIKRGCDPGLFFFQFQRSLRGLSVGQEVRFRG